MCESPEPILTSGRLRTAVLAILMSSLLLWMLFDLNRYPCEHDFHDQIDSPVLAVELASRASEVEAVLAPRCEIYEGIPNPRERQEAYTEARQTAHNVLLRDTIADCFFIPLYNLFLWSFGSLFALYATPGTFLRRALAMSTITTAIADYVENIGIFRSLAFGPSNILAQWTSGPSRIKWTLFALSLLLTALILLRSQNKMYSLPTRRLLALGYFVSGMLVAIGVWHPVLIELGMTVFSVIVVVQIVALLAPYVAHHFPPDNPIYEDDFCKKRAESRADLAVHE